ncbi:MAG: MlaA family lipoprotein [Steroidobacteraceae bacterium]
MLCAALRSRAGRRGICLAWIVLLTGCAAVPGKRDPHDPWERMNRATYRFNDALDRGIVKPVAKGYKKVVPRPVRTGLANVLDNAGYTTTIANDLLQAKFKAFGSDIGRILLNSTLGIGGLLDPASAAGLAKNDEDFGQTLGRWGVHGGPYLLLPVLGPSTVRDTVGMYPDWHTDLKSLPNDRWLTLGLDGLSLLGRRVELLSADEALSNSYDPYAFMRNAYLQHREYEVRDGDVPEEPTEEVPVEDETTPPEPPPGP